MSNKIKDVVVDALIQDDPVQALQLILGAMRQHELEKNLPKGTIAGGEQEISELTNEITNDDLVANQKKAVRFSIVDSKEANKIKTATGLDVEGYKHTVDSFGIRHILSHHGNEKAEKDRGQQAVNESDIAKIPEIVKTPDKIEHAGLDRTGNELIRYTKSYENTIYYVEEVREKRKELVSKSMWKTQHDVNLPNKLSNSLTSKTTKSNLPQSNYTTDKHIIKGRSNNVKTAKGTKLATVFALVEATQLIASHTATGTENPRYPQELQPRDRGRESSQAWVQKTAANLDPDSLGRTGRADTGAPIVGDDMVVESGNGRTMAIQLAYERGTADEYKDWLNEEAEYFGFTIEQVAEMQQPVLVRIRQTAIDRAAFAVEANQDDKLSFTATERAKSDAKRIDDNLLQLFMPSDDGDLLAASNQKFIQGFLRKLGDTESAQYITKDGKPTQALVSRIKAAVFSKAYDDDRLLEMMADQTKPDLQNMLNALSVAAPKFIEAQSVSRGDVADVSSHIVDGIEQALDKQVSNAIIDATNVILKAKRDNQDIKEFVKQQGLFEDLPDGVADIAVFLASNARSAKKMSLFFKTMAEFVEKQAIDGQNIGLFGEPEPLSVVDVVQYAISIVEDNSTQSTMFDAVNIDLPTDDDINADPLQALERLLQIAQQQQLDKAVKDGFTPIEQWTDEDSQKATSIFAKYLKENSDDYLKAAKEYFVKELQGKKIKTRIGLVSVNSKSKGKMLHRLRHSSAMIIPYIPEILLLGNVGEREELNKERKDDFVAFYTFEKTVTVNEVAITARIKVGELHSGLLAYYLAAKKEAPYFDASWVDDESKTRGVGRKLNFDSITPQDEDNINIEIVKIIDLTTGKEITEEEAERLLNPTDNGRFEYVIWGIPQNGKYEELLVAKVENKAITSREDAERICDVLKVKHGVTNTRIQVVDLGGGFGVNDFGDAQFDSTIDDQAHQAATSPHNDLPQPTEEQKQSGDYPKGRLSVCGLPVSIENPAGSTRSGVDENGVTWESEMKHHYGFIENTLGADGDELDVFIKKGLDENFTGDIYVISQVNQDGSFDEHKVVIGATSIEEAKSIYLSNYDKDWQGMGQIEQLSERDFKSKFVNQNMFDDMGYKFTALPTDQQIEINPLAALYQLLDVAKQRDSTKQATVEIPLADELKPSERNTAEFYQYSETTTKAKRQKDNDAAIALLKQFDSKERALSSLTDADREVLAKYTGSGGNLVTADGKKGSAYEYYTPKPVAEGMWALMEELGFSGGKVLDPCAGMGIFGATAPKNAVVDAVELDAVSGNINKFVNQNPTHNVTVSNFEKVAANTPDESYDAVITNVPFGDNSVRGGNQFDDAKYQNESLEAYFILRTLEKLKPNGLAMFITPPRCVSGRGLKEERLRSRASMLAEFMGAYRLPNKVFGAASADTITDVMVFKKHSRDALDKIEELSSTKIDALIDANVLWQEFISGQYFKGEGKRFILGDFVAKDDTKYRDVDRVINDDSVQNISKLLRKFGGSRIDWEALDTQESDVISYNDGDMIYQNGQPLQYFDGVWQPVQLDEELLVKNKITESIMAKLSTPYDAFIYKISHEQATQVRTEYLNQGRTMALPNWLNLVLSQLDAYVSADKKPEHWNALLVGLSVVSLVKAYADDLEMNYLDSFKALSLAMKKYRTFKAESGLVSSFKAAIKAIGIHYNGTEYSALWRGERQSIEELQGELTADQQLQKSQYLTGSLYVDREQVKNIYKSENPNFDPLTDDEWVVAADGKRAIKVDDLCVGNLKAVLDTLDSEIALASDDDIRNNLLAAKKKARDNAHFTDVSKLSYKLNSPLVTTGEKLEFAKQFIDASAYVDTDAKGRSYVDINIKGSDLDLDSKLTNRIGDYFKNGTITLGGISLPKGVTAEQALAKLRKKINEANTQFSVWVKANPNIQARLEATAKNPENVFFKIANDDSPLEVDGISPEWKMHGYQNAEIRRQARQFGGINGFNVGLGKTATALVSVQHAQNIGVKNKTLFIVPSAVLSNWRKEAVTGKGNKGDADYVAPIYANGDDCLFIGLTVDKNGSASVKSKDYDRDLNTILENRHKKIFMTYEAFQRIPMQEETVEKYVAHLRDVDSAFAELERTADDNKNESKIAFIVNELMKGKSAAAPFFEDMGIDSIVIDEGHSFKNSKEAFNFESAKFLSLPQASSRALDAQAKCWYVRGNTAKNDGVLLLTATPVTNSPLEIYSMLSLAVGEEQINKQMLGIRGADDFLKSVCTVENDTETSVDGISKDYAMFTGLDNLEILRSTIGNIANVQDAESVGAVFHLPESPENAEPIRLDANIMDKIKLYQQAYRAANAIKRDKPVEPDELKALEIVVEETNEDASLIAEPFNLIQKMNNLSLDAELNKRVTFVFVAEDKKKIDAVVAAFNKLKIVVKGVAKLGQYTEQDAIVKTYKVKDGEKFYNRYDFQVKARYDEHQKAIILDSIDFATQAKLEKILDDNELEFDYASTPKYAALVNNVKNELEKPRGLKRDGSKSRVVKQIVFSDMLATHNKIRRILNKKAGIPLHKITFISGQFNNEPEQLLEVQAGFNGFDDENLYNIIIGNKKAEVGINLQSGTQAIHHLTIGWTPDSLTQRNGRGVRQGNMTKNVNIYYYDAEGTFDAYKRRLVNKKEDWINNLLTGDSQRVAVSGGLTKEQQNALINMQDTGLSMEDMQAQMEQAELKARSQRTVTTQIAQINTISTAKYNMAHYSSFTKWVDRTVGELVEVKKRLIKTEKDLDSSKISENKRVRLEQDKAMLLEVVASFSEQLRPAFVKQYSDEDWSKEIAKVAVQKYNDIERVYDSTVNAEADSALRNEWQDFIAQNERVAISARQEVDKLSNDNGALKQDDIDAMLQYGYIIKNGQVLTKGTVVRFLKEAQSKIAPYGLIKADSDYSPHVYTVRNDNPYRDSFSPYRLNIETDIEIVEKNSLEYEAALRQFALHDSMVIKNNEGKFTEKDSRMLASYHLQRIKDYIEDDFEILLRLDAAKHHFKLPLFPMALDKSDLPKGSGDWITFYNQQEVISTYDLGALHVSSINAEKLDDGALGFDSVLDFMQAHSLKFQTAKEMSYVVKKRFVSDYGFTASNIDISVLQKAVSDIAQATDAESIADIVKQAVDKTLGKYIESLHINELFYVIENTFSNPVYLAYKDLLYNAEQRLKALDTPAAEVAASAIHGVSEDDYVYMSGDSYSAKEYIDFRAIAKRLNADIAWHGKKIRGNNGVIIKKAPKAPVNTWVMQRKVATKIQADHAAEVSKYNLEFKEAS